MQEILLSKLHPDPRSSNRMSDERFQKLVENIQETGKIQPLTVRPHPENTDEYIIIDGYYRREALLQLRKKKALCDIWDVSDLEAGLLLATLNRLRGEDHPKKRALLIQDLLERFEKERLSKLIPESTVEIDALLVLIKSEEAELTKRLKEQIEKEALDFPVVLNFVLNQSDATFVNSVVNHFDQKDRNHGLVLLCREVESGQKS